MANGPQQPQQAGAGPDEFELLRRRLQQRGATRGEARQRDLNRRFAAAGGLPSGAAFKIRQQAQEAAERQTSEDVQDVNILQAQTLRQEREAQRGREFAREERIGAQEFAGQQAQLGREFQTAERVGAQEFAGEQAALERGFAADERRAAQAFASAEAALGREFTAGEAELARDFAREEAATGRKFQEIQAQFQREHETTLTNLGIESNENIAMLDRELRRDGLDIQKLVAESNIEQSKVEAQLNTFATFVNAIGPMSEAGFNQHEINDMVGALGIDFPESEISKQINKKRQRSANRRREAAAVEAAQFRARAPSPTGPGGRGRPGRSPGQLNR